MSTWNLPPGVTTNDLPGNTREDQLEEEYIAQYGGIDGLADALLDGSALTPAEQRRLHKPFVKAIETLRLNDLQIAEWCGALNGDPDFETWVSEIE